MENDDQVLLPTLIDERARSDPERLYCAIVRTLDVTSGVIEVSYGDFANAVNRCSWWLENKFGKSESYETLAYVGSTDLRYAIITLAAVKTGHKAMLVSPANSIAAQLKLLKATNCKTLLMAGDFTVFKPAAAAIASEREIQIVEVANLESLLEKERVPLYAFEVGLKDDPRRPYVVLHTSGSTGLPEPIVYSFAAQQAYRRYVSAKDIIPDASPNIIEKFKDHRLYMSFPPFHMVGLLCTTILAVYWNMPPIVGPPNVITTAELASNIAALDICQSAILSPAVLQEMTKNPALLKSLDTLDYVIWCGAPLSSVAIADSIRSHAPIYPAYGATETGPLPLTLENQDLHEWMNFNSIIGAKLKHYAEDLYELVIVKDTKVLPFQFVFLNFPDLEEWPTKDLMSKHPTRDLWRYRGRRDDIIVMSNGLKINPLILEGIVMSHPQVISALLIGTGRTKAAWLIEPRLPPSNESERITLVEDIWPSIEKVNEAAPKQARIEKDWIMFTTKEKPMARAGKGSVQRQTTVKLYEKELGALYQANYFTLAIA